jgi:hypothetical protein
VELMLKIMAAWFALSVSVGVLLGRVFRLRERTPGATRAPGGGEREIPAPAPTRLAG